jgi:plastocyanin
VSLSPRLRTAAFAALAITTLTAVTVASAAAARTAPRAVRTHEVKMITDAGKQLFEPKQITIQAGDTVKWVTESGSHNVAFWADSLPANAAELLRKTMPEQEKDLSSPRKPGKGNSYSISFAGMPKGVYKYFCTPHLTRGQMVAQITVQ